MAEQTWYGAGGRFHNKIYVGNLSSRTRDEDIRDVFIKYGDVVDIVLKYDFAFVEMENEKDMEEAIDALDGHECHGRKWLVEPARRGPSRNAGHGFNGGRGGRDGDHYGGGRGGRGRDRVPGNRCPAGMRPTRGNYRLQILGLSSATSWQDLKDWARQAGDSVCYGDVFVDNGRRMGIIEYDSRGDFEYALERLNGDKLHGKSVTVYKDGDAPPIGAPIDTTNGGGHSADRRMSGHRGHDRERRDHRDHRDKHRRSGRHHHHRHHHRRSRSRSNSGSRSMSRSRSRSGSRHRRRSRRHRDDQEHDRRRSRRHQRSSSRSKSPMAINKGDVLAESQMATTTETQLTGAVPVETAPVTVVAENQNGNIDGNGNGMGSGLAPRNGAAIKTEVNGSGVRKTRSRSRSKSRSRSRH